MEGCLEVRLTVQYNFIAQTGSYITFNRVFIFRMSLRGWFVVAARWVTASKSLFGRQFDGNFRVEHQARVAATGQRPQQDRNGSRRFTVE